MKPNDNNLVALATAADETAAQIIGNALAEYDVRAIVASNWTARVHVVAGEGVPVMVRQSDLERAQKALAEIAQDQALRKSEALEDEPADFDDGATALERRPVMRIFAAIWAIGWITLIAIFFVGLAFDQNALSLRVALALILGLVVMIKLLGWRSTT